MARFKPGEGGRPKGAINKITRSAREAFQIAFDDLGGADALKAWAIANPTEFFKLYSRLIPMEVTGAEGGGLVIQIVKLSEQTDIVPAE